MPGSGSAHCPSPACAELGSWPGLPRKAAPAGVGSSAAPQHPQPGLQLQGSTSRGSNTFTLARLEMSYSPSAAPGPSPGCVQGLGAVLVVCARGAGAVLGGCAQGFGGCDWGPCSGCRICARGLCSGFGGCAQGLGGCAQGPCSGCRSCAWGLCSGSVLGVQELCSGAVLGVHAQGAGAVLGAAAAHPGSWAGMLGAHETMSKAFTQTGLCNRGETSADGHGQSDGADRSRRCHCLNRQLSGTETRRLSLSTATDPTVF